MRTLQSATKPGLLTLCQFMEDRFRNLWKTRIYKEFAAEVDTIHTRGI